MKNALIGLGIFGLGFVLGARATRAAIKEVFNKRMGLTVTVVAEIIHRAMEENWSQEKLAEKMKEELAFVRIVSR